MKIKQIIVDTNLRIYGFGEDQKIYEYMYSEQTWVLMTKKPMKTGVN